MNRQIRKSVFETNSSSMHSLTVTKTDTWDTLHVNEFENKVITEFGEFGWEVCDYYDAETKLSYIVTMLVETNYDCYSLEELYETDDFKLINDAVADYCNCDGILINSRLEQECWNGKYYEYSDHDGYIDHQSVIGITELLYEYGCTMTEFIFNRGVVLHTDNDNH